VSETKARIEQALAVLVGKPLWGSGRAADMETFQFGAIHSGVDSNMPWPEGAYALHVQCPWRIVGPDHRIIVGYSDLRFPAGDPLQEPPGFDPNKQMWITRRKERLDDFYNETDRSNRVVTAIEANELGDVRITFSDGCTLETFADDSLDDDSYISERWRLLRGDDVSHFVMTGGGIDELA
jgi:hypothetical protein